MDLDLIHVDELGTDLLRQQHSFTGRAGLVGCRHALAFWTVFRDHLLVGAEATCGNDHGPCLNLVARGCALLNLHTGDRT